MDALGLDGGAGGGAGDDDDVGEDVDGVGVGRGMPADQLTPDKTRRSNETKRNLSFPVTPPLRGGMRG